MLEDYQSPFPNPYEILKFVLKSFGLNASSKRLAELCQDQFVDQSFLSLMVEKELGEPLAKYVDTYFSEEVVALTTEALAHYASIVRSVNCDGLSREQLLHVWCAEIMLPYAFAFLAKVDECADRKIAVGFVLEKEALFGKAYDHLLKVTPAFNNYKRGLLKNEQNVFSRWLNGKAIPNMAAVSNMVKAYMQIEVYRPEQAYLLIAARAFDFVKKEYSNEFKAVIAFDELLYHRSNALAAKQEQSGLNQESEAAYRGEVFVQLVQGLQRKKEERLSTQYKDVVAQVTQGLLRTREKLDEKEHWSQLINQLEELVHQRDGSGFGFLKLHQARFEVFCGNLPAAVSKYKEAMQYHLFTTGTEQQKVLEEAQAVAAALERPDKVFLANIQLALDYFSYDSNTADAVCAEERLDKNSGKKVKKRAEHVFEDWEIKAWRTSFVRLFPKEGFFRNAEYPDLDVGLSIVNFNKYDSKVRAAKDVNKPILVKGPNFIKKFPPLVLAVQSGDASLCNELLEKGADVNAMTVDHQSAVLFALAFAQQGQFDMTNLFLARDDLSSELINARTSKKRLTLLGRAVELGDPEIVSRLVELGADVNQLCYSDNKSPLYWALTLLEDIATGKLSEAVTQTRNYSAADFAVMKREFEGRAGATIEQMKRYQDAMHSDPVFQELLPMHAEQLSLWWHQQTSLEKRFQVAQLLVSAGADVNQSHSTPISGYTPLMLACEFDQVELVGEMLQKGGDPYKTHKRPNIDEERDCFEIAKRWKASRVEQLLAAYKAHAVH